MIATDAVSPVVVPNNEVIRSSGISQPCLRIPVIPFHSSITIPAPVPTQILPERSSKIVVIRLSGRTLFSVVRICHSLSRSLKLMRPSFVPNIILPNRSLIHFGQSRVHIFGDTPQKSASLYSDDEVYRSSTTIPLPVPIQILPSRDSVMQRILSLGSPLFSGVNNSQRFSLSRKVRRPLSVANMI